MHEFWIETSDMSDLAHEGARYAVSGRMRLKQMVILGMALLQSSNSKLEMVDIDFPLEDLRTISFSKVASRVVPLWVVGNG